MILLRFGPGHGLSRGRCPGAGEWRLARAAGRRGPATERPTTAARTPTEKSRGPAGAATVGTIRVPARKPSTTLLISHSGAFVRVRSATLMASGLSGPRP